MKIESAYSKPSLTSVAARTSGQTVSAQTPESAAVNLSAVASALQGNENPPVNAARIQEIKLAIAQGHFKINPEAIADGLLDAARDLINSQRRG